MFASSTLTSLRSLLLSAHSRTENLVHFAHEFAVRHVAVTSEAHRGDAVLSELPSACELHTGSRCAEELVELEDVDVVLVAIVAPRAFLPVMPFSRAASDWRLPTRSPWSWVAIC